jgi:hypothetical protein
MASSGYGQAQADATRGMIAHTKTLLNAQLKQVLSAENLKVSGVKSDLQIRIISREFGLLPLLLPLSLPLPLPRLASPATSLTNINYTHAQQTSNDSRT